MHRPIQASRQVRAVRSKLGGAAGDILGAKDPAAIEVDGVMDIPCPVRRIGILGPDDVNFAIAGNGDKSMLHIRHFHDQGAGLGWLRDLLPPRPALSSAPGVKDFVIKVVGSFRPNHVEGVIGVAGNGRIARDT